MKTTNLELALRWRRGVVMGTGDYLQFPPVIRQDELDMICDIMNEYYRYTHCDERVHHISGELRPSIVVHKAG